MISLKSAFVNKFTFVGIDVKLPINFAGARIKITLRQQDDLYHQQ